MIRAEKSRNKRGTNIYSLTNIWIKSHLGIKPEKGGNPPRERRAIGVNEINRGEWWRLLKMFEKWYTLIEWKRRIVEEEIRE